MPSAPADGSTPVLDPTPAVPAAIGSLLLVLAPFAVTADFLSFLDDFEEPGTIFFFRFLG